MGLLNSLKKAFSGSKTKARTKRKTHKKAKKTPVESVETSVGSAKIKHSTERLLSQWSDTLKNVQDHPLSQVKIINTNILTSLTEILGSMNNKLDNLQKLDEIIGLLNESRDRMQAAGLPVDSINKAISRIQGFTVKDKEAVSVLKSSELTTEDFAKKAKLSRSTASTRLNRLYSFGLVEKGTKGKQIIYKLRQKLSSKD